MADPVQKVETVSDSSATCVLAYTSNVTSGNLLTVEVTRYTAGTTDPFVVGDLTKSAGTATIGTIALDASGNNITSPGAKVNGGIFSIPCTGTGSLTFTVSGNAGDFWWMNISEWTGYNTTKEASNAATGTSTTPNSGNATSAGAALFVICQATNQVTNDTITENVAFTLLNEEENGTAHQCGNSAFKVVGSGNTDSGRWTNAISGDWVACVAVYAASGGAGSVALTGTATGSITETDVRNGGKTIILTLTGDTYVAAGTGPIGSLANTQSLIAGIDSAQAEATGWDSLVKAAIRIPGDVVRTSSTVATITLPGVVDYNITATETITATVPGAVLTGANPLVATPTFTVSSDGSTPDFQDLTGVMAGM